MGVVVRKKVKGSNIWWVFVSYKGRRTSKKVGTQRNAEKVAEHIEARIKLGKEFVGESKRLVPTLGEHYKTFERTYLNTAVRHTTQSSYESNYRLHILPVLGHRRLNEITRAQIKDFVASLVEQKLARPTIRIITSQLCALLNQAIEDGIIDFNPATNLAKFYKNAPIRHKEIQPLTEPEIKAFLRSVLKYAAQHFATFLAAIHTGMRTGELVGLQWTDVDFFGKFIIVRRAVVRRRIVETKTDKVRKIDLSDALAAELKKLKRHRQEQWLAKGQPEIPQWVFCAENGNFMDPYNLKDRYFYKYLEKAGLRRIRFHDLRHTFATLLLQNGESLAYVKDQLGHSSIRMTVDVYGHLVPGANRQAVNKLPSLSDPTGDVEARQEGRLEVAQHKK